MSRTALQVIQSAAPRLAIARPTALFSSTDELEIELQSVLNECAVRITQEHDWQALKTLETNTGDGSTTAYSLPSDYLRMPIDAQVWSTRWQRPLISVASDDWLRLEVREYDLVTGTWTLLGGQVQYKPALASGELAKWYYISRNVVAETGGSYQERFMADTDTFRLDDRVLELTMIWQWREQKGLEYAEDMANAEQALAQAIARDKGARIVTQSSRRNVRAKVAYPWQIVP